MFRMLKVLFFFLLGLLGLEEGAEIGEKATLRDHLDNPLFVLIIIALFVYAFGAFGRSAGNRFQKPGITSFFGG